MTTLFKNKEHYLAFRAEWASAVNSPKAKSTLKSDAWSTWRVQGWVHAEHSILFNILTNRHIAAGFTPITKLKKLDYRNIWN